MLKFNLITDTHYYNYEKLGYTGHKDQVALNESGAIIDAVFDKLLEEKGTDIVLIAGDLCTNGERVNHEVYIEKLRRLQEGGKRVFVITASHDYSEKSKDDAADGRLPPDKVFREELPGLYHDFGFSGALAVYEPDPFSYVAQLAPGYRLICLNTDGDLERTGLFDWAEEQIKLARADGQYIFAMHHYPVLPPSPIYPIVSPNDVHMGRDSVRERLADAGLRFVFTGHTHMQNIGYITTPAGNRFYDINTGAAVGYPAPIRTVVIDDEKMTVTTGSIDSFKWDLRGKSVRQYLSDSFDRMLNGIFEAGNSDVERMLDILNGEFRVNKEALLKYRPLLSAGGKILYRMTLGQAGTALACRGSIPTSVRDMRVKDLIMEIVRNIYGGDEPYSKETPVGAAVFAIMGRVETLAGPLLKKVDLPFDSLRDFIMSLIYDANGPDSDAVLPLS